MKYFIPIILTILIVISYFPEAQGDGASDPWLELRADTIIFDFPAPDSINVQAIFSVINNMNQDTVVVTDVGVFLDGEMVDFEEIGLTESYKNCRLLEQPECHGECYTSTTPPITFGECEWFEYNPLDSIPWGCFCITPIKKNSSVHYSGQHVLSFEIDIAGMVYELDEFNNVYSVIVSTIPADKKSWGEIKDNYNTD